MRHYYEIIIVMESIMFGFHLPQDNFVKVKVINLWPGIPTDSFSYLLVCLGRLHSNCFTFDLQGSLADHVALPGPIGVGIASLSIKLLGFGYLVQIIA